MIVKIKDVMGISEAEIPINQGGVTWITGPNMSGKSSAAACIAAVCSLHDNPVGLPATAMTHYVRAGADTGKVDLIDDDDGRLLAQWEAGGGVGHIDSDGFYSTRVSTGLVDMSATLSKAARAELWEDLFAPPMSETIDSLAEELKPLLEERTLKNVLISIGEEGFRAVVTSYAKRATEAKRAWTKVAGETYGSAKAKNWVPDDWKSTLDGKSVDECEAAIREAQLLQGSLQATQAVSIDKVAEAKETLAATVKEGKRVSAELEEAQTAAEVTSEAEEQANAVVSDALAEANSLQATIKRHKASRPTPDHTMDCPACKATLKLAGDRLLRADDAKEHATAELREWEARLEELNTGLNEIITEGKKFREEATEKANAHRKSQQAVADLDVRRRTLLDRAKAAKAVVDGGATEESEEDHDRKISEAESAVRTALADKALVERLHTAREQHNNALHYTKIKDTIELAAVLQAKAIQEAREKLNRTLASMAKALVWPPVEVSDDYVVTVDKRKSIKLLSESERWRARVMLQGAICREKWDHVLIIDRADVLDDAGRSHLVAFCRAMTSRAPNPAMVVCASPTFPPPSLPNAVPGVDVTTVKLG